MIGIRCDAYKCGNQIWGLAFNAKPANWTIVELDHGDHRDYCPNHTPKEK